MVKVKKNQPKLYKAIESTSAQKIPIQKLNDCEKTRNGNSCGKIEIFEPREKLDSAWVGVGLCDKSGT